ncbi:MAG: glutathione S-transferase family protein [Pseudophaeobacter sp. bin_em_oilr2.035]|jgi:glutathione S-transferase|uniref:Glutathione S-transferase family protein n=1 Tax=Ruegeria aquimaris TaxID=2984333 RepID=A0ABT3AQT4_9RHOB|nr:MULTISPECIES: glutathione S-transferase family protein [Rhodobacterales]MCV2890942.1 glutathione S-transferase family protein [Ruegeria sp. XHP0148]MDF1773978.1 glutathione S-transferase family protein [Pseudophaeobacter sp. bin_em_oilr2.035]TNE91136.1 MAG: glutathione S-transferase family protein [Paracoccaceae bacterium]
MRLYNANFSPNALRVRAVAFELGADLEIIEVDVFKGDNRAADFLARNPNAKVPVLEDGDFVLWESRAICAYLASLRPEAGLVPADPKSRGLMEQWAWWQAIHLGPAMQKLSFELFLKEKFGMGEPDAAVIEAERKASDQFLDVLEQGLAEKDWILGTLSLADLYLATTFMYRRQAGISLDDRPAVAAWIERLEARESWQKAMAPLNATLGL